MASERKLARSRATCADCGRMFDGRNAAANAKRHADQTGHVLLLARFYQVSPPRVRTVAQVVCRIRGSDLAAARKADAAK